VVDEVGDYAVELVGVLDLCPVPTSVKKYEPGVGDR
jgi:hypothetical protein